MLSRYTKSFLSIVVALCILTSLVMLRSPYRTHFDPLTGNIFGEGGVDDGIQGGTFSGKDVKGVDGGVIMPKLGNATAKAALGQATWKLMHTMTLRYPEAPTQDERDALKSYFYLQARLYPCGECAAEFQQLLKKFPPQTSTRRSASMWLCHVHNQVNERLGKPNFDCAHLDETYDCGCGDAPINPVARDTHPPQDGDQGVDDVTGVGLIKGGR